MAAGVSVTFAGLAGESLLLLLLRSRWLLLNFCLLGPAAARDPLSFLGCSVVGIFRQVSSTELWSRHLIALLLGYSNRLSIYLILNLIIFLS